MLATRARIDEVEVLLGGGVDGHLLADLADRESAQVIAGPPELVGEIVQDGPGRREGGAHSLATKAIERLHFEVFAQGVNRLVEEKGVAVVR